MGLDYKLVTEALENLVDKTSLEDVVDSLAELCLEKAEHLESNWQDTKSASSWLKCAKILEKAIKDISNIGL